MDEATIVSVTDEPSTSHARAYQGGTSVEVIYECEEAYVLRHIVFSAEGDLLHDTFKPTEPPA